MAIIPEQQVQTSTLRGVDPTQFLQQAYREQQANVAAFNQMNATIQQEAQKFIQKQEEKKQKEMTYSAILPYIQQMSGGDAKQADALAKQIASNPASSSAILNMVQMSQEQEAKAADQAALQKAFAVSRTPEGGTDYSLLIPSFIEFGGSNVEGAAKFVSQARKAEEGQFEPKAIDLGNGITVVQTGPNTSQVITPSGDAKIPAGVQVRQYEAKQLEEAMQAYHQGDDAKVNTIFLQLDLINKITGQPLDPFDIFGERKQLPESEVPSLSDSGEGGQTTTSLDDLVSKYQQ
tara:strand:- start:2233 stop:3105 length:873 start_codon:yes stop_codon:yes gene_type:complete